MRYQKYLDYETKNSQSHTFKELNSIYITNNLLFSGKDKNTLIV